MSAKAARRLLIFAFALSLLVHIILSFVVPKKFASDESTVVRAMMRRVVPITIAQVQPTPKPRPQIMPPHAMIHPRTNTTTKVPKVSVPVLKHAVATSQPMVAAPSGSGSLHTEAAVPTPTPRPCNASAALAASPDPPEIAPEVRAQMASGISRILVNLDANGSVLDARVASSSGSSSLDQIALTMARAATYLPARVQCKPVAGTYAFSARFLPW